MFTGVKTVFLTKSQPCTIDMHNRFPLPRRKRPRIAESKNHESQLSPSAQTPRRKNPRMSIPSRSGQGNCSIPHFSAQTPVRFCFNSFCSNFLQNFCRQYFLFHSDFYFHFFLFPVLSDCWQQKTGNLRLISCPGLLIFLSSLIIFDIEVSCICF